MSQSGEDGIIEKIFEMIAEFEERNITNKNKIQWCIEFGCWDGKYLSNTFNLIKNHHWSGILIEADSKKYEQLIANYAQEIADQRMIAINEMVSFMDQNFTQNEHKFKHNDIQGNRLCSHSSIEQMYPSYVRKHNKKYKNRRQKCKKSENERNENPKIYDRDLDKIISDLDLFPDGFVFDLIVIDVDGNDYHIFDSIFKYKTKVLIIEFNPSIANHIIFIQPRNINLQQGSSLLAIINLAKSKGYELISTTTYNAFFVQKDIYRNVFQCLVVNNSIYKMHDPPMITDMFQLYDGTLVIEGCKKLIWHRIPIKSEDIQVLKKKSERIFPYAPGNIHQKAVRKRENVREETSVVLSSSYSFTQTTLKSFTFIAVGFVIGLICSTAIKVQERKTTHFER